MGTLSSLPSDSDAQIGWFHDLAEEVSAGRSELDAGTQECLAQFVKTHLPGHPFSGAESEAELAGIVRDLRANELAWNRALQAAILRADDAFRGGNGVSARQELERFSRECPWRVFSEVALDQACLYEGLK
jgi:hypothetical protein